ncbi:MAG: thioredoxin-dependent thiol peroxidase [Candidatus Moraniibacteriota bacterium]
MPLTLKQKAPAFSLPDQEGRERALNKYLGKWVALYFYPKDDTPGCTAEACSFRDGYARLKRARIVVLAVSADSVKSHKKFSEKYSLPFPLLADGEKKVVQQYGVLRTKQFMGREYIGISRTTFLIDPAGRIAKIYENMKPDDHAEEILADVKKLNK